MKQYLLAVQFDESAPTSPERELQQQDRTAKVTAEMQSAGSWVLVGGLLPSPATTVVRPDKRHDHVEAPPPVSVDSGGCCNIGG